MRPWSAERGSEWIIRPAACGALNLPSGDPRRLKLLADRLWLHPDQRQIRARTVEARTATDDHAFRCEMLAQMDDDRLWELISLQQSVHPLPGDFTGVMALAKPFPPELDDTPPESRQRVCIAGNPVVREVAAKPLTQCLALFGQRLMSILSAPFGQRLMSILSAPLCTPSPRPCLACGIARFTTQSPA